jgi:hypothetical protein
VLINNAQLKAVKPEAATRPLAGNGAGAFPYEGVLAGSLAGDMVACKPQLRPRWAAFAGAGSAAGMGGIAGAGHAAGAGNGFGTGGAAVRGGSQPASRTQFEHTTLIDPVAPGRLGSHPVREPEPV